MLTRCPSCHTAFRVRDEQLQARHGRVRCGKCHHPFNAYTCEIHEASAEQVPPPPLSFWIPGDPEPGTSSSLPTPPSVIRRGARSGQPESGWDTGEPGDASGEASDRQGTGLPDTAAEERADAALSSTALDFGIPDLDFAAERPTAQEEAWEPVAPPPADLSVAGFEAPAPVEAQVDFNEPQDLPAPPQAPLEAPPASHPAADFPREPVIAAEAPVLEPSPQPAAEESNSAAPVREERSEPAERPEAGRPPPLAADPADAWRADDAPPQKSSLLLVLLNLLLLLVLAGQALYYFRDPLTRSAPALRPWFVQVCAELGCTMPLPRQSSAISIVSSDLRPRTDVPGNFELEGVIRNRAPYTQAFPHLELTLSDANNRVLARRVFRPEEWVQSSPVLDGMPPSSESTTRLLISTGDLGPVGYQLYAFYP